ncbi:sterol desaturase family protein [Marinobacter sp. 1-3A]|uniref:sterol desaturase family protein n=1 Tax=Marinobacter sp. 1-3A TaxID=2582920 RepID=UPI002A18D4C9|nr:sterol desaturase family protein [Marinobacter sp. 1-3A]
MTDTLAVRLVFPVAAAGTAFMALENGWGLLNLVPLPSWLAVIVSILVLDAAIYFQHRLFHAVPWLWRLHRVHHSGIHRETDNFGFSVPWWAQLLIQPFRYTERRPKHIGPHHDTGTV